MSMCQVTLTVAYLLFAGFEVAPVSQSEGAGANEDSVDVAIQGGDRPNTRAGGAKGGRGGKKKL